VAPAHRTVACALGYRIDRIAEGPPDVLSDRRCIV
jgi:hypothetical protein